ncbi:MAG: MotA/TolQ/ExbB proton channel family protein [Planctomycetota bacterium]
MIATLSSLFAAATAVAPQDTLTVTTVGEFFDAGGTLMWAILGCSVVVTGLAIERYLSLRRTRLLPPTVGEAVGMVQQGQLDSALAAARADSTPALRVLAAGFGRRGHPLPLVEKAMEDQMHTEAARLRGNVHGISLMAAVAPLLGLLGTVLGIAEAFATVEQTGLGKPENLAAGIKVALYTTIFGLCVAIPATLVAAHLQARVRRILQAMAEVLAPAVEPLSAQGEQTHAA